MSCGMFQEELPLKRVLSRQLLHFVARLECPSQRGAILPAQGKCEGCNIVCLLHIAAFASNEDNVSGRFYRGVQQRVR